MKRKNVQSEQRLILGIEKNTEANRKAEQEFQKETKRRQMEKTGHELKQK